jgi:hypothetical protein
LIGSQINNQIFASARMMPAGRRKAKQPRTRGWSIGYAGGASSCSLFGIPPTAEMAKIPEVAPYTDGIALSNRALRYTTEVFYCYKLRGQMPFFRANLIGLKADRDIR